VVLCTILLWNSAIYAIIHISVSFRLGRLIVWYLDIICNNCEALGKAQNVRLIAAKLKAIVHR
ncbi:hypothetical protein MKW94_008894, partial [Papaver nudicaule]|nr:hypothetical protein [Papaver nudicaule]